MKSLVNTTNLLPLPLLWQLCVVWVMVFPWYHHVVVLLVVFLVVFHDVLGCQDEPTSLLQCSVQPHHGSHGFHGNH
jgi:hypothetical protein